MTAFQIRRERRGLSKKQVAVLAGVGIRKVTAFEENSLFQVRGDSLTKLKNLNYRWTIEDYER